MTDPTTRPVPAAPAEPGATEVAELFHTTYERLAPGFGYRTRDASAVPWADVPEANKALMIATATVVLAALAASPAPADEGRERATAFDAWMRYEEVAREFDGWPATNEVTDAASELIATLSPLFAATDSAHALATAPRKEAT